MINSVIIHLNDTIQYLKEPLASTKHKRTTYIDIAVNYVLAIGCEKSVCHFIQTIGFYTEMFVVRAKGFL